MINKGTQYLSIVTNIFLNSEIHYGSKRSAHLKLFSDCPQTDRCTVSEPIVPAVICTNIIVLHTKCNSIYTYFRYTTRQCTQLHYMLFSG
jgi:hypothetical protein